MAELDDPIERTTTDPYHKIYKCVDCGLNFVYWKVEGEKGFELKAVCKSCYEKGLKWLESEIKKADPNKTLMNMQYICSECRVVFDYYLVSDTDWMASNFQWRAVCKQCLEKRIPNPHYMTQEEYGQINIGTEGDIRFLKRSIWQQGLKRTICFNEPKEFRTCPKDKQEYWNRVTRGLKAYREKLREPTMSLNEAARLYFDKNYHNEVIQKVERGEYIPRIEPKKKKSAKGKRN